MKRLVIILFLVSICYGTPFILVGVRGDTFTSHLKPITDGTLDVGTATLLWRYFYGDSFTDGTALWDGSSLSGFVDISAVGGLFSGTLTGNILTDGTFIITGGVVTVGTWNGTVIDISDYTNLVAGTNITLVDDTLNVDDAFLINDGDDTTTGIITSAGFTTTGAVTAGASTFGDGGTTDYVEFSDTGRMTMYGDARVERHITIGASSWKRGVVQPTETYENIFPTLSFQDGQDDAAHYAAWVPYTWDNTTDMEVHLHWQHETVNAGKVKWHLIYIGLDHGEDPAGAGTEITQITAGSHAPDSLISTIFATKMLAANLARDDDLGLKLWREGTDGVDDTLTEDAELIAIHIHYTINQMGQQMDVYFLLLETGDFILLETGDKIILEGI